MDVADVASQQAEGMLLECLYLSKQNDRLAKKLHPVGYCHNCYEEFGEGKDNKLFCDGICATSYNKKRH